MIKKQLITIQHSIPQVPYHNQTIIQRAAERIHLLKQQKAYLRKGMKFIYFNPSIYPFHPASDKQISPRVVFSEVVNTILI